MSTRGRVLFPTIRAGATFANGITSEVSSPQFDLHSSTGPDDGLGEDIDTPLGSLSGRPRLSPKRPAHYDKLSDVETLWLRWVASVVVGVTTDLRHTDSRGLLHDQSSARRHLSNPPSRDSLDGPHVLMRNAIINIYHSG